MPERFQFRGKVLPQIVSLSIDYRPVVSRAELPGEPAATYALSIQDGVVKIDVAGEFSSEAECLSLHGPAYDLSRTVVELAGLSDGVAYHVLIDEAVFPDGRHLPLLMGDHRLAALIRSFHSDDLEAVADLVLCDPPLARALSDVVSVMSWPHYSPIACGRVADSLLRLLTPEGEQPKWARLHEVLRVDRAYVQPLSNYSAPPRHGDRQSLTGAITSDLAARAWTLFDRYLAYRLGGGQPLDADTFPTLHG
jgi:hypothetical protein